MVQDNNSLFRLEERFSLQYADVPVSLIMTRTANIYLRMFKMRMGFVFITMVLLCNSSVVASITIPANDPNIQYYGRWDFSNPSAPSHSWPGVYIFAVFQGTSIGMITDDNACWYNVFIDSVFKFVFHGTTNGVASYPLVSGLSNGSHTILITKRGETSWTKFSFYGFILDDGKSLLPPP